MSEKNSFIERHRAELESLLKGYKAQLLNEVIPFWQPRVLDRECGGYFNFFTRDGHRYDDRKPGWFAGRTFYMFSALCLAFGPREEWAEIAHHGRRYLDTSFYAGNGRFNRMLSRTGQVLEGTTSIFTDHFAIKGLYEYMAAFQQEGSRDMAFARSLSDQLFAHVKDAAILAVEAPKGMQKLAIDFMTLLVAQESRKIFGGLYQPVVEERLERILYLFCKNENQLPLEYLGLDGCPVYHSEGRILDPGHMMEALWFAMHEGHTHNRPELCKRGAEALHWVVNRCYDEEYGGFFQHCDIEGKTPDPHFATTDYGDVLAPWDDKIWWVQCEGQLALAMGALYNQDERLYQYFIKMHHYTDEYFRDKDYGEWYPFLTRDGTLRCDLKGTAGKGPYHVPRCLLQLVLLLEGYLFGEQTTHEAGNPVETGTAGVNKKMED